MNINFSLGRRGLLREWSLLFRDDVDDEAANPDEPCRDGDDLPTAQTVSAEQDIDEDGFVMVDDPFAALVRADDEQEEAVIAVPVNGLVAALPQPAPAALQMDDEEEEQAELAEQDQDLPNLQEDEPNPQ